MASGNWRNESKQSEDSTVAWPIKAPHGIKFLHGHLNNVGERHYVHNSTSTFTQNKEEREIEATECSEQFKRIADNADNAIEMMVNPSKTTHSVVCVSPAIHSNTSSYVILDDGTKIARQDSMTLLGFRFEHRPNVPAHLDLICKKWIVRHLKVSGVPDVDIARVFASDR